MIEISSGMQIGSINSLAAGQLQENNSFEQLAYC
jgi:hypothetical protein